MKNKQDNESTNDNSTSFLWNVLKGFTALTAMSSMFGGVSARSNNTHSTTKEVAYSDANLLSQARNTTPDLKMGGFTSNALVRLDTNNKLNKGSHVYLPEGDAKSDYEFLTLVPKTSKMREQIISGKKYIDEKHILRNVPEDLQTLDKTFDDSDDLIGVRRKATYSLGHLSKEELVKLKFKIDTAKHHIANSKKHIQDVEKHESTNHNKIVVDAPDHHKHLADSLEKTSNAAKHIFDIIERDGTDRGLNIQVGNGSQIVSRQHDQMLFNNELDTQQPILQQELLQVQNEMDKLDDSRKDISIIEDNEEGRNLKLYVDEMRRVLEDPEKAIRLGIFDGVRQQDVSAYQSWEQHDEGGTIRGVVNAYRIVLERYDEPLSLQFIRDIRTALFDGIDLLWVSQPNVLHNNYNNVSGGLDGPRFGVQFENLEIGQDLQAQACQEVMDYRHVIAQNLKSAPHSYTLKNYFKSINAINLGNAQSFNIMPNEDIYRVIDSDLGGENDFVIQSSTIPSHVKSAVIEALIEKYNKEGSGITNLMELITSLERMHPFHDWNARTFCVLVLNKELLKMHYAPSLMDHVELFDWMSPDRTLNYVQQGYNNFKRLLETGKLHEADPLGEVMVENNNNNRPVFDMPNGVWFSNITVVRQLIDWACENVNNNANELTAIIINVQDNNPPENLEGFIHALGQDNVFRSFLLNIVDNNNYNNGHFLDITGYGERLLDVILYCNNNNFLQELLNYHPPSVEESELMNFSSDNLELMGDNHGFLSDDSNML